MRDVAVLVRPHLQVEMFQSVVLEVERVWSGAVRGALLAAGVEHVSHSSQLEVGRLLHGVVVADLDVPEHLVRPRLPPVQVCGSLGLADGQLLLVGVRLETELKRDVQGEKISPRRGILHC